MTIELKPVTVEDASLILSTWGCHPKNFSYLTASVFVTLQDAERYVKELYPTPESRAFHILLPGGELAGIVKAAIHDHRAQVGYVVHEPFWGRGIATSAVRQVLTELEELPRILRIWATCAIDNPASARVLEKCGFQREGILRNWVTYPAQGGRPFDNYSYVKLP